MSHMADRNSRVREGSGFLIIGALILIAGGVLRLNGSADLASVVLILGGFLAAVSAAWIAVSLIKD